MRLILIAAGAVCLFALAQPGEAEAAGFDCNKAATPTERTICNTRSLNDKDVRMVQLYDIVRRLVPMGTKGAIMDRQAVWLRERNRCGADRACLQRSYDRRIGELNRILEDRVYPQGPF